MNIADWISVAVSFITLLAVAATNIWGFSARFSTLEHKIDAINKRLDDEISYMKARVEISETRLDRFEERTEKRFDKHEGKIDVLQTSHAKLDTRVTIVETRKA